ncbi:MAG: putative cysteine desulfurase 2 [Methanomassiliicoccales archaeon PtaU1.Bin124]|nr:MAG: putative cysteine desulfurase 2 [Methanomassiliicoccales archaeon PtaU1.Bin124]
MDVAALRKDFPLFDQGKERMVYLDSACQSLRPRQVIQAMDEYYLLHPACAGRSVHRLATQVSLRLDDARDSVASFLNASSSGEIVFTKNCTESLNLVAKGWKFNPGDVIVSSAFEHNSNHVPWLELQSALGLKRRFAPATKEGEFDLEGFKKVMDRKVKMVSIVHTNNVNGVTVPLKEIVGIAHDNGALVNVDGAQSAPHMPVDVRRLDVDFFSLSAHKMLGPSGMGVLYGKLELLEKLRPLTSGGGSVLETTYDSVKYLPVPERFEAGLLNYAGIIGTGAAVEYLKKVGMENVAEHERKLNRIMSSGLKDLPKLRMLRPLDPDRRGSIFSFNIDGMRSHDVAMILDEMAKVMVRSGNHCAHPYFDSIGVEGCARASSYIYNDEDDAKEFVEAVKKVASTFAD